MGTTSADGVEKLFPLVPAITAGDGVVVEYSDIEGDYMFTPRQYVDIFTQGKIKYAYNATGGVYSKEINITNVDAANFKSSYVQGVSDTLVATRLWKMAHKLWETYGVLNPFPEEVGNVPLIANEEGAVEFLENFYKWQGVEYIDDAPVVLERYSAKFSVGLDFLIINGLDHGSKVRLDIPTITDGVNLHRGLITDISLPISDKSMVSVTAAMLGNITAGGGDRIINESGAQTILVNETGSNSTLYNEGGL